ncbi:MAG: stage II sporulation protein M [Nanoarchaeota archaeon]
MKKIINYYKKSFEILNKNKKLIFLLFILYFLILFIGLAYNWSTYKNPFSSDDSQTAFNDWWKANMLRNTFQANFFYLFFHNVLASGFRIISGIFFCIIPIGSIVDDALSNSYTLVSEVIERGFLSWFCKFIPHSIFEIPALIISSALGVSIFFSVLKKKQRFTNLKNSFKDAFIVFVFIILPLLLIAAVIESFLIMIFNYW